MILVNNSTRRYEVPDKCIQISEEGFLGSTYANTVKVINKAASLRSTSLVLD